jgi:rhamnopyranosyl-N-acetylglucosaminyl-diphospho-decaprenol beta-1,3/1,4-galactofuranosyltransferase
VNNPLQPKIAAVIVTYNRINKLKHCLECTVKEPFAYIVIVDNNSSDGTREWLSSLKDCRIRLRLLDTNTGGAGGFHEGIKYASKETDTEWVCCYDDDAFPEAGLIKTFIGRHQSSKAAMIASAVYSSIDGSILEMNRPITRLTQTIASFLSYSINKKPYVVTDILYQDNHLIDISAASMVGLFINCEKVRTKIGLPDPNLFIYCDDLIYTSGAKLTNESLQFDPCLIFQHDCINDPRRQYSQAWKAFYLIRNYAIYYRQIAPTAWMALFLFRILFILINSRMCNKRLQFISLVFKAVTSSIKSKAR